ncbi:MAG TPA: hypothetical protein EYH06_01380 [Chromatiales bacterium]|nr:hypothetical protein [Thiotrichales bacterium]HIP67226.1 hypothetical protein [Chromatiales bacterium]
MIYFNDLNKNDIAALLANHGLTIHHVPLNNDIPGSFWGNPEAGLISNQLYVRADTPIHSLLHEACHYICMPDARRVNLHTDAGGDYDEENAVCYLQILLADQIQGYSAATCMEDMDTWGYSFRLGSTQAWFEQDAEEARTWLKKHTPHLLTR